ncbi:CsbD family protein [Geobacter sp. AOG2]|uniref:CsbD family protein n=1 Tax=Geobacter sp. AOG2 TaxID=1566347 RepID=UPI001CC7B5E0|nr:CsbD family protein [Geobacter sp. AOG2]GFE60469.1 hypothetical protein AOG2_10570 [Geobacter sp. AOG2]
MKLSTKFQARGLFHRVRGTVREITGKVCSNTMLGTRGKLEKVAGKVQWKIGKVQGFCGL